MNSSINIDDKKIKIIADVTVLHDEKVLMVKYSDKNKYDHQSGWFLPDDIVSHGEHHEDATSRIMDEQLGLKDVIPIQDHIESFTGNDGSWHLVFHFKYKAENLADVVKSDDVDSIQWYSLNALPPKEEVAHHGWALYTLAEMNL